MGAWSHQPFDNDDAADWLAELLEQDSMTMIVDAFCAVTRPVNGDDNDDDDEYIELPEAAIALAAAKVLRMLMEPSTIDTDEHESEDFVTEIRDWGQQFKDLKPTRKWCAAALEALKAATSKSTSELYEVWHESTEFGQWKKTVSSLSIYFKRELKRIESE